MGGGSREQGGGSREQGGGAGSRDPPFTPPPNTRPKEITLSKVTTDPNNPCLWKKKITNTLMKINIIESEFLGKKQAKTIATQKINEYQINKIYKAADNKSKAMDYVWNKLEKALVRKGVRPGKLNN